MDPKSFVLSDFCWARILSKLTDYQSIPCYLKVSDGEVVYQVVLIVEDDLEEELMLSSKLSNPTQLLEILRQFSI